MTCGVILKMSFGTPWNVIGNSLNPLTYWGSPRYPLKGFSGTKSQRTTTVSTTGNQAHQPMVSTVERHFSIFDK